MTIRELYNWAQTNEYLDYDLYYLDEYQMEMPITVSDETFDYYIIDTNGIVFK